jgi:hypothetical protein
MTDLLLWKHLGRRVRRLDVVGTNAGKVSTETEPRILGTTHAGRPGEEKTLCGRDVRGEQWVYIGRADQSMIGCIGCRGRIFIEDSAQQLSER